MCAVLGLHGLYAGIQKLETAEFFLVRLSRKLKARLHQVNYDKLCWSLRAKSKKYLLFGGAEGPGRPHEEE